MDNEHLRILDLSWNHFRLKGAVLIAEMVKENYGLKYLNLMMNGIGDDGAAAMGTALKTNQCLVELNLMANRISEAGAISVAKGLLVNDVLETIRVSDHLQVQLLCKHQVSTSGRYFRSDAIPSVPLERSLCCLLLERMKTQHLICLI